MQELFWSQILLGIKYWYIICSLSIIYINFSSYYNYFIIFSNSAFFSVLFIVNFVIFLLIFWLSIIQVSYFRIIEIYMQLFLSSPSSSIKTQLIIQILHILLDYRKYLYSIFIKENCLAISIIKF